MKKYAIAAALAGLLTAAPAHSVEAIKFNWSGAYIGGFAGAVLDYSGERTVLDTSGIGSHQFTNDKIWANGGIVLGYNWISASNWTSGIEADFTFLNAKSGNLVEVPVLINQPPAVLTISQQIRWLANVRGRIGFVSDATHWFVTGGVAWNSTDYAANVGSGAFWAQTSFNAIKTGWVAGAGVERMIGRNWSLRTEYLVYGFGEETRTVAYSPACCNPVQYSWSDSLIHQLRVGLSYKFSAN